MWKRIGRIFLLFPAIAFASELNFTASVDRTQVGLGKGFTLTISAQGDDIGGVPSPELPELPDFHILSRSSSQSTSIQFIDGKMSQRQSIDFVYVLSPKRLGKSIIAPVRLEYKGNLYETRAIEINVLGESTQRPPPQSPTVAPTAPEVPIKENLMLVASADRKSLYWGEQVVVEFTLYNRLHISDINLAEIPTFNGFWVKPIYDAKKIAFQRKSVDGKSYEVCLLKKSALFPLSSGELKISQMKLNVAVLKQSRDFFGLMGRTETVVVQSEPINIHVKPLPTNNKPGEFTGGVGEFTVEVSLDRTTSQAAEPVNFTIRIAGVGNISFMEKPGIPTTAGVRILDPEIKENLQIVGNRLKGYKEFRYPVIPQTDGEHIIPSINIAYFDPKDETYHTIKTDELRFIASQTAVATEFVPRSGLKILGSDINYIKSDLRVLKSGSFAPEWWLVFFYLGSLAIIAVAVLFQRHQARLSVDRAYARRLRSNRLVKQRLKEARTYLKGNDEKEFYAALSRAVLGYLGDRYNWDVHAMTKDELQQKLAKLDIEEEAIEKMMNLLNQSDIARFSPSLITVKEPEELLVQIREVLRKL